MINKLYNKFKSRYPLKDNFKCDCYEWVYVIKNNDNGLTKIGITQDLPRRYNQLYNQSGCNLELLYAINPQVSYDESAKVIEETMHDYYKKEREVGEWFKLSEDQLKEINECIWEIEGEDVYDCQFNNYI
tara:strand:+ start:350 stop:739 length:390 start_codon:yes stop_codon:yes gene_type:complete